MFEFTVLIERWESIRNNTEIKKHLVADIPFETQYLSDGMNEATKKITDEYVMEPNIHINVHIRRG